MASFERRRSTDEAEAGIRVDGPSPTDRPTVVRRRSRLARGPLTIGEPAPAIDIRLSAAVSAAEPYRPDLVADGGTSFGLVVRAASVRGLYKRYQAGARQDDLCIRAHAPSGTLVVAVADGVSGAPRSDLGAALAVRQATSAVVRQLETDPDELDWDQVFAQAAWALVEEQRRQDGDPEAGVEAAATALATTLVVGVITAGSPTAESTVGGGDAPERGQAPERGRAPESERGPAHVRLAAVGDSPAFLLNEGTYRRILNQHELSDGLLGGAVEALPRSTRPAYADTCTLEQGSVLLLCTDGFALPLAGGTGEVGRVFARELASPPEIADFARLLDFSRATYDDDRTLVAIWRER
jgi:serine/threonine protein phosphatase PrpC